MSRVWTRRRPRRVVHRGISYRRTQHNHREAAFADLWEQENQRRRWLNYGGGVLQDLMVRRGEFDRTFWKHVINNRDAAIVATVVQWFGSNVGFSFIERALARCGYKIVSDETWAMNSDCCGTCRGRGRKGMVAGRVVCGWCKTPWHAHFRSRTIA